MDTKFTLRKTGTIEIISSGGIDRFAYSIIVLNITVDKTTFRIDSESDYLSAYLALKGWGSREKATDEQKEAAFMAVNTCPCSLWANYKDKNISGQIVTAPQRISAGIYGATGYPNLNSRGITLNFPIMSALSKEEWSVVRTGLEKINADHAKRGLPVVEFSIPDINKNQPTHKEVGQ